MSSRIPSIFDLAKARNEVRESMRRVIDDVSNSRPVDPEDLVVIRGSSELFAEITEHYTAETHTR